MKLRFRNYTVLSLATALLFTGGMPAIADTPQETAYECSVAEGSTIRWTPGRNLVKNSYAKEKEFLGSVTQTGENVWLSDYAHLWDVDPERSRVIIGPTGKLESGEIRTKPGTLAVVLRNTKRTYLVNVNIFNPYIRIENNNTLVAGIGANWADVNNGKSAETEPVDVVRGEFDFTLNEDRTAGTLTPHSDELGGLAPHTWIVPADDPHYEALRVGLRDAQVDRPYERVSANLIFTCTPFQRDVTTTSQDGDNTADTPQFEGETKYCTIGDNSTFAWGIKRSWRDYLMTLAAGKATHATSIDTQLANVAPHAELGLKDARLAEDAHEPRQSRYQYLFPIDTQRSYLTLNAQNEVVDMKIRTHDSWVRFTSEDHGFDNAILMPEAHVYDGLLRVSATPDISMTRQGSTEKIEKIGGHAEFLRGTYAQQIADDLTSVSIAHQVTGTDSRNRIEATSVYTKNSDSALVFAGNYDDGVEADPATLTLALTCRDITEDAPKPADPGRADVTPLDRAAVDNAQGTDISYELPGVSAEATGDGQSVNLPEYPLPHVPEPTENQHVFPGLVAEGTGSSVSVDLPIGVVSGQGGSVQSSAANVTQTGAIGLLSASVLPQSTITASVSDQKEKTSAVEGYASDAGGSLKASAQIKLAATGGETAALLALSGLIMGCGLLLSRRAKR